MTDKELEDKVFFNEEMTAEVCPICDHEVEIKASKKEIQYCPECGAIIVPCSMCDLHKTPDNVCNTDDCPAFRYWGLTLAQARAQQYKVFKQLTEKGYFNDRT